MSQSPIFRPDPFDPDSAAGPTSLETDARGKGLSLTDWVNALSEHGGGTLSTDLALDLVLNEIVERARAATAATAAAIALLREEEIVCRATTGENAPGLGVPLNTRSGLSGACVQSKRWQRCDDTETDGRVDRELCRKLGMRSILVVPVLKKEDLLGVIEIFSSNPNAFSERETQTLQGCAQEVVATLDRAAKIPEAMPAKIPEKMPAPEETAEHDQKVALSERVAVPAPTFSSTLAAAEAQAAPRDVWTTVLMVAVIALALSLGWVVGRSGRQRSLTQSSAQPQEQPSGTEPGDASVGRSQADQPHTGESQPTSAGLVVYQNDKMIYPKPSPATTRQSATAAAIQPAAERSQLRTPPLRISPDTAKQYITQRVEPEYPADARERGIQGPVVLDALVGEDGAVQKFAAIRGDPQLAAAAATAVRQWRFRPFMQNGRPQEFQTRITVDFKLASQQ